MASNGWFEIDPASQAILDAANGGGAAPAPAPAPASATPAPSSTAFFDSLGSRYQADLGREMDSSGSSFWKNLDANTAQTDAELKAQWDTGVAAELAGRKKPQSANPSAPPYAETGPVTGPTPWDVAPNQTVASQLEQILKTDSPLMQQARTRALQRMNANGTVNSAMANSAAESAMIDAAMPIATQDASTFASAGEFNAGASNTFGRDANQFTREQQMANFNLSANDWANQRALDREIWAQANVPDKSAEAAATAEQATLQRGYINAINQARTDYASNLANISASTTMDTELKQETLTNLKATYNTMITNYAKLLGWDEKSWIIAADAPAPTPAPTPAPVVDGSGGSQ